MPRILFVEHNGREHWVEAKTGDSLMRAATDSAVPGILGDCGGACSCATCHAYIPAGQASSIPAPASDEVVMLEGALHVKPESRLSCQVFVTDEMDGLRVELPESQL